MEMFFLSYVNELCTYLRLCLSSSRFCLKLRKPVCFTHGNVLLSYVNATMYLLGNLPFSRFMSIFLKEFIWSQEVLVDACGI